MSSDTKNSSYLHNRELHDVASKKRVRNLTQQFESKSSVKLTIEKTKRIKKTLLTNSHELLSSLSSRNTREFLQNNGDSHQNASLLMHHSKTSKSLSDLRTSNQQLSQLDETRTRKTKSYTNIIDVIQPTFQHLCKHQSVIKTEIGLNELFSKGLPSIFNDCNYRSMHSSNITNLKKFYNGNGVEQSPDFPRLSNSAERSCFQSFIVVGKSPNKFDQALITNDSACSVYSSAKAPVKPEAPVKPVRLNVYNVASGSPICNARGEFAANNCCSSTLIVATSSTSPAAKSQSPNALTKPLPPTKPSRLREMSQKPLARCRKSSEPPTIPPKPKIQEIVKKFSEGSREISNDQRDFKCNNNDAMEISKLKSGSAELHSVIKPEKREICVNSPTIQESVLRKLSNINENIKKPSIRPPPPPSQSTHSQHTPNLTFHCHQKDMNIPEDQFMLSLNINKFSTNSPPFHRRYSDFNKIPSLPTISPPPIPPKDLSPDYSLDGSSLYEEIEQSIIFPDNVASDNEVSPYLNDSDQYESSKTLSNEYLRLRKYSFDHGSSHDNNRNEMKSKMIKSQIFESTKKSSKRPISTIEFDKLLRIKSDIQLNITKKVGQIKLKVSSASQEKHRRQRAKSMFYVNPDDLKTDEKILAHIEFPINEDEECIYGDDWSSEDDVNEELNVGDPDCASTTGRVGGKEECEEEKGKISMLEEIEQELNFKLLAPGLPDVVPKSESFSEINDVPLDSYQELDDCLSDYEYDKLEMVEQTDRLNSMDDAAVPMNSSLMKGMPSMNSATSDYQIADIDKSVYIPRIIPNIQPLYQIYMMEQQNDTILLDNNHEMSTLLPENLTDKNMKIRRNSSSISNDSGRGGDYSTTISQITSSTSVKRDRLVACSHFGSQRSLWCELPEVKNSGLLEQLDDDSKKLQEAFFEVITSEASYLRSLNILITHFMAAPELLGSKGIASVITNVERKHLFSNILSVRDCSERLLCDLESRLELNLVLADVSDIICEHFGSNFDSYVKYCSNQVYQDRTLKKLKCENSMFMSCVQRLENNRVCQGLDMRSFLMLPMQRITRYPLLVIAILERTTPNSEQNKTAQLALHQANKVVNNCNEGARRMERTEQLLEIERRLIYKSPDLKRIALVTSGRYLIKRGMLTQLLERRSKNLLSTKQHYRNIYIFLFSDIILIAKKKLNGMYVCKDYSARKFVDIEPIEADNPKISNVVNVNSSVKLHLFICTLMQNARGRQVELLLNTESESDRERWLSALRPPACSNPEERIYADWDCPQAIVVHDYNVGQEDELRLSKGDIINILRKMPDGWFYGERVSDGVGGWFPSSYVQQILNDHVRAKHYRHRLRVIQAAASYQLQQEQMKACRQQSSTSQKKQPIFLKPFRRLSNPKSVFISTNHGSARY